MGACYSVDGRLLFTDNTKPFVEALNKAIDSFEPSQARFRFEGIDRTKLEDMMKVIVSRTVDTDWENGVFTVYGDFSASYGWWSIMCETFRKLFREGSGLAIGSRMELYLWDDQSSIEFSINDNGQFYEEHQDVEDEDEDEAEEGGI